MYGQSTRDNFVTLYKRQVRKSLQSLNFAVLTIEGIRIWENMMPAERKRFEKRLSAINAQPRKMRLLLRHAIETYFITDQELRSEATKDIVEVVGATTMAHDQPMFFMDASISPRTGYPEEITIVKFSVSEGVEEVFHAQFSCKGVTKHKLKRSMNDMSSKFDLIQLRGISEDSRNLEHVYSSIREFAKSKPLFAPRIKHKACLTAMLIMNLADTEAKTPPIEVLQAEMLVDGLIGLSSDSSDDNPRCFPIPRQESSKYLACDLHRDCGVHGQCTMHCALTTAYTFGELITPAFGVECVGGRHIVKEGFRPECFILEGSDEGAGDSSEGTCGSPDSDRSLGSKPSGSSCDSP